MYFCPDCNNVFDITKGIDSTPVTAQTGGNNNFTNENDLIMQHGGKDNTYEEIIKNIINGENIDGKKINNLSMDDLTNSIVYKKLKHKQKESVYNKLQDLLPNEQKKLYKEEGISKISEKAYFICNNCGNRKPIEKGTLIFSKVSSDIAQSYSSSDVKDMKYSDILPITRKYICPNKNCDSHTNPQKREAVFFRMNNTFKVKHICLTCDATF